MKAPILIKIVIQLCSFFLIFMAAFQVRAEGDKLALLVSNTDYVEQIGGSINRPQRDIELIEVLLNELGFKVEKLENGDRIETLREISKFVSRINIGEKESVGILYYSGHGFGNFNDGKNYVLLPETDKLADNGSWYNALNIEEIHSEFEKLNGRNLVFLLDACINQQFYSPSSLEKQLSDFYPCFKADLNEDEGKIGGVFSGFITSHRTDENHSMSRHSLFARALFDGLVKSKAKFSKLMRTIADEVYEQTGGKRRLVLSGFNIMDFTLQDEFSGLFKDHETDRKRIDRLKQNSEAWRFLEERYHEIILELYHSKQSLERKGREYSIGTFYKFAKSTIKDHSGDLVHDIPNLLINSDWIIDALIDAAIERRKKHY